MSSSVGPDTAVVLEVLRWQAWERAKGELRACRMAFYTTTADRNEERLRAQELENTIERFIEDVENRGLQE